MYNPTVKEFLKENPDLTVIGIYWAGCWRLNLIIWGIYFGVLLIAGVIAS